MMLWKTLIPIQSLNDLKHISEMFGETARNWEDQSESVRNEYITNYLEKATTAQLQKKYDKALTFIEEALKIDESNSTIWNQKGNIYLKLENLREAKFSYERAVELDPKNPYVWCNLGLLYSHLRNYSEAKKFYDNSISINPNLSEALNGKAYVELKLGEYQKAKSLFDKAVRINARDSVALKGLAEVHQNGFFEYEQAKKYAESALDQDHTSYSIKLILAEVLLSTGQYIRCEELAAEVRDNFHAATTGFVARHVLTASFYFRKDKEHAIKAGMDLLNYFKSLSYDQVFDWNFRGLKHLLGTVKVSKEIKDLLLLFIKLVETESSIDRKTIISDIESKVSDTHGYISRSLINIREYIEGKKLDENSIESIEIENISKPDPLLSGWYNWEVFLKVSDKVLASIYNVEYTLHESFPQRVIVIDKSDGGFRLKQRGWGEFRIKAVITTKDGNKITKYHWLNLVSPHQSSV